MAANGCVNNKRLRAIKEEDNLINEVELTWAKENNSLLNAVASELNAIEHALRVAKPHWFPDLNDMVDALFQATVAYSDKAVINRDMRPVVIAECFRHVKYVNHGACILNAIIAVWPTAHWPPIYQTIRDTSSSADWAPISFTKLQEGANMSLSDKYIGAVVVKLNMLNASNNYERAETMDGVSYTQRVFSAGMMRFSYSINNYDNKFMGSLEMNYMKDVLLPICLRESILVGIFNSRADNVDDESAGDDDAIVANAMACMSKLTVTDFVKPLKLTTYVADMLECMVWEDFAKLTCLLRKPPCVLTLIPSSSYVIPCLEPVVTKHNDDALMESMNDAAYNARQGIFTKDNGLEVDPTLYMTWVQGSDKYADGPLRMAINALSLPQPVIVIDSGFDTMAVQEYVVYGRTWLVPTNAQPIDFKDKAQLMPFLRDHTAFLVKYRNGIVTQGEVDDLIAFFENAMYT